MKLTTSLLLLGAALAVAPIASAQLSLHNFSAFEDPATTVFLGDWAANGDPISGDVAPIATFAQAAGSYHFIGGTNADTAGAFYFYASNPGDLTGLGSLDLSARLLAANAAPTITISLFDSSGESAFAVFATSSFTTGGFSTVKAVLTTSAGFNAADLAFFQITGGVFGGTDALNIALDSLVAAPVPEPATWGLFGVAALLALAAVRRQRAMR